jgi:MFS family permease
MIEWLGGRAARSVAMHLHAHYRAMLVDPRAAGDEVAAVHAPTDPSRDSPLFTPDSGEAWMRLALALVIGSIGSVGMWSVVVVLPVVQAEFGATRGAVSLAFTLTMLGFGLGGVATGKITDRFGIVAAMALSITFLGTAYVLAGLSTTLWQFILVHVLIGLGTSATFGPLMAEASHWFERYRGLAVTIVASGNYVGGTIWPPLVNWGMQSAGWRTTHIAIGIFCAAAMTLVLLVLRAQIGRVTPRSHENAPAPRVDLRLSTNTLTVMLCIASIACCVAMAMPQVHIVAYCGDLGYGVARGAEMLSLMMAFGVVSRIGSGFLADKIRHPHLADRIRGAGLCAVVLSVLRRPDLALHHLGDVRPVSGRHRAELRHHRP